MHTRYTALLSMLLLGLLCGCGNSDGSLSLTKNQTAELVKSLGTYEGPAHAKQIMGAMMSGVWTATFFQNDNGDLKCKCTLRLHDSENGWGNPTTATADVKVFKGSADGECSVRVEGAFSESEPDWTVDIDGIFPASGHPVGTITLFDMDSYQIELSRK